MKKKNLIRILIMVVIVWIMCFFDCSLADAQEAVQSDPLKKTAISLNTVVSILSWFWVYLANLAWTFLTNNWIYAEALKLDVLLRKFWNVIKNMANFCLWFYFIYTIFKWLFRKDEIMKNLKNSLLWILVAWVWIQASWFFTAAVIDISSITLAAVWSLPSQVISQNTNLESAMKASFWWGETLNKWIEVSLFSKDAKASSFIDIHETNLETPISFDNYLDSIMPNPDNVAWPLYFMWYSILKTLSVVSINDSSPEGIKSTILTTIMQWWTTIIFAIEMGVLCIVALIRVVYLWMFIVFSPFAILLWCFKKSWGKWGDFVKTFEKYIGLKTFFWNVFKPTIIVLGLWVATIFVSLMTNVVNKNNGKNFDLWWAVAFSVNNWQSNAKWKEWDLTYTTSLYSKNLDIDFKNAWKTLLEFMLSIITVLIVYYIIKLSITIWWWNDFVSKTAGKLQENVWKFITQTPMVPITAYDNEWVKHTSAISLRWLKQIPEKMKDKRTSKLDTYSSTQVDETLSLWWINNKNSLTETQKVEFNNKIKLQNADLNDVKKYIDGIKTDTWRWMKLSMNATDSTWRDGFALWLSNQAKNSSYSGPLRDLVEVWRSLPDGDKKAESFPKLFNNEGRVTSYVKFFGLDKKIERWNELKEADISSSSETE